jgi:hypothetical protein
LLLRLWTFKFLCTPFSFFPPSISLFPSFCTFFFFFSLKYYSPFQPFIQHCPSYHLTSLTLYKPLSLFIFQYYPLVYLLLGGWENFVFILIPLSLFDFHFTC